MMKPTEYLRETIDIIKQIETRFLELGSRLYTIREKRMWEGTYDSFNEFLDTARITPGHASILISIHKNYIIEGKRTQEQLAGIGYSNLYESIPLIEREGVENAVIIASTLTRSEIKDEVRDIRHGEHDHEIGIDRWATCKTCNKFIRV